MKIKDLVDYLKNYDGPEITIMEVCGSHTAAIAKNGIRFLLSKKINLVSGPGCPVCVTPSAYIDKLIELALEPDTCVLTFGDLIRVPGSKESLGQAKTRGAEVEMVYSPMDALKMAEEKPEKNFVFAAVGFETTAPVYTLLLDQIIKKDVKNLKLLTALKTMPAVIDALLSQGAKIDGFVAPGHVSTVTGYGIFEPLAEKFKLPFAVAGFEGEELIIALYGLVKSIEAKEASVKNYYTSVVVRESNPIIEEKKNKYFVPCDANWRGVGQVPGSGLMLRDEFSYLDAGSAGLDEDIKKNKACRCGEILRGQATPNDCPLFGKVCTPQTPQGACMVSYEGCCFSAYNS
ncbi:MAG: hydrogenase formation protein HypD [Pseudobutyrivibrio sp.]|nr:hydrogenase formation protein HypD [Pseudobutyrivibrio sp.]